MSEPLEPIPAVSQRVDSYDEAEQVRRRRQALTMHLAGATYDQIADQLQLSHQGAVELVRRSLTRTSDPTIEEMRAAESARLDRAQLAIWQQVTDGNLKAVQAYLKISARRAKLHGLDKPTRFDVSINVRQEMEQALAQLENVLMGEVISDERSYD